MGGHELRAVTAQVAAGAQHVSIPLDAAAYQALSDRRLGRLVISRTERVANYAVLCLVAVIALFPILGIMTSAVTPPSEATGGFSLPHSLDWANFSNAWRQGHLDSYMRNSLIVSAAVVVAATVFATMAGFAFGTMRFRGGTAVSTCSCSG